MALAILASPGAPLAHFHVKCSNKSSRRILRSQCQQEVEFNANKTGGYRPAVILPVELIALIALGLGNNSSDYQKLASLLEAKGVHTVIAKVSRPDWLRNAAGLLDANYWKGTLCPRPVLDWYLKRIEEAVSAAKHFANGREISLIGHSAGGWLARLYLTEYGLDGISLLLTLGTPHLPPLKGVPGVIDQTRGLLDYVEKCCPVASYMPQVKFVCIAGRYIKGERFFKKQSPKSSVRMMETAAGVEGNLIVSPNEGTIERIEKNMNEDFKDQLTSSTLRAIFVGQGYKQVCGEANVWGDGVVPEVSAHLDEAINITLEGVYHSPVGSDDMSRPWYGSSAILDKWVHYLLD